MTAVKNYEMHKLDDLTPGDDVGLKNAREKLADIPNLANDIEANGLLNPFLVWKTKHDGEELLVRIGGARREAAIKLLIEEGRANGFATQGVPCNVVEAATLKEAMYKALADNIQREQLTSYEIAMECQRLKTTGDSQKVIAKALSKSETWVSRKLKILDTAGPALLKAWKSEKLSDDSVETLAATGVKTVKGKEGEEDTLDYSEQDASVEEALKLMAGGSRKGKSKARKAVKAKAGKHERPGTKILREMTQLVDETDEKEVERPGYVQGIFDCLRFAQGIIPLGKLGPEWKAFVKASEAAAEAKAEADAEKAKAWAEGQKAKKGKKGKKAAK